MKPFYTDVTIPKVVPVKNLGWLIRNSHRVEMLEIQSKSFLESKGYKGAPDARLIAHFASDGLRGAGFYQCDFASFTVCSAWVKRPCIKGVPLYIDGQLR